MDRPLITTPGLMLAFDMQLFSVAIQEMALHPVHSEDLVHRQAWKHIYDCIRHP